MLETSGDLSFATALTTIILVLTIWLMQPSPNPVPPRRGPSPSPEPPYVFPAAVDIASPYDEDTIVNLLNELYSLYVLLAFLRPEHIIYPDPATGRHNINQELCNSLGIDRAVISLMERMPYMDKIPGSRKRIYEQRDAYGCCLFPGSRAYSFLRDEDITESRDPEFYWPETPRLDYLLSCDIALGRNVRDGWAVVVDTKANTVRMLPGSDMVGKFNPDFVPEKPEDSEHYRNTYTQDAPSYLRDLILQIRSLELIPVAGPSFWWQNIVIDTTEKQRRRIKMILEKQFGWPDNFRQDDWVRDGEDIWDEVFRLDDDDLDKRGCIVETTPMWMHYGEFAN